VISPNQKKKKKKQEIEFYRVSTDICYEVYTPFSISNCKQLKDALKFIEKERILDDIKYVNSIEHLLSGVSLKKELNDINLLLDFFYPRSEGNHILYQINLICKKKNELLDDLTFEIRKVNKLYMNEIKPEGKKKNLFQKKKTNKMLWTN